MFRFIVVGTPAEIEAYKAAQGEFFRESDDKRPLFFTTRSAPNNSKLIITQKGKVVVDMSEFDAAASLVAQYGGNLGQELARSAVAMLTGTVSQPQLPVNQPVDENPDLSQS